LLCVLFCTIRNERERRATAILAPFMPCGAKLPVIALFAGAFFGGSRWVGAAMYFVGILIILFCAFLINLLTGHKVRKSFFIMELAEYKAPSFPRALLSMCQRGWSYIVKAGTVILVCNFAVQLLLSFSPTMQFLDYDGIKEEHVSVMEENFEEVANGEDQDGNPIFTYGEGEDEYYDIYTYPEYEDDWAALSEELRTEAGRSILAKVATPFAYLFAPISGQASWELAASSITGFIAKENVVGTLQVCFGVPNQINDDFEIIGDGAGLKEAFGIGAVAALAYLMFNLFTPPCFAAMGAMNAEIKSKKWLFAGIALQFGIGYSIAFLVNFFGSLFTGSLFKIGLANVWMPILGWAFVGIFAATLVALIIRTQVQIKKEYKLSKTKAKETVKF